jgi:predicted nucleic acid-binding protein
MGVTVDSSFVIDILRSESAALAKDKELKDRRETKFLTTPVLYEITSGLLFTRSRSEAAAFHGLASGFPILSLDEASARRAAEIRAELLHSGKVKDHVDVMLAGITLEGGHTLVTRDKDFQDVGQVMGLNVETY